MACQINLSISDKIANNFNKMNIFLSRIQLIAYQLYVQDNSTHWLDLVSPLRHHRCKHKKRNFNVALFVSAANARHLCSRELSTVVNGCQCGANHIGKAGITRGKPFYHPVIFRIQRLNYRLLGMTLFCELLDIAVKILQKLQFISDLLLSLFKTRVVRTEENVEIQCQYLFQRIDLIAKVLIGTEKFNALPQVKIA